MKLILLALIVSVVTLVGAKESGEKYQVYPSNYQNKLSRLNSSVKSILSVSSLAIPGDQVAFFWDLINPVARFLLLNQTQVSSLPFDVISQLRQDVRNLNWAALPAGVQSFLLAQSDADLLSLTYLQWGWVDTTNTFASTTLYSLLPANLQNALPNAFNLLAPVTYDFSIDLTVLNQTLYNSQINKYYNRKRNLVVEFFESFFEQLSVVLPEGERSKRSYYPRLPTAASTYKNAVYVAQRFLKSLNPLKL